MDPSANPTSSPWTDPLAPGPGSPVVVVRRAPSSRSEDRQRDLDDLTLPVPRPGHTTRARGGAHTPEDAGAPRTAVLHAGVTAGLLAVLGAWTLASGQLPALHPVHAPLLLVLHMGAWMTGWLGVSASVAAIRGEATRHGGMPLAGVQDPTAARWAGLTSAVGLALNSAMVVGALLM